jgi:hypothetical protein
VHKGATAQEAYEIYQKSKKSSAIEMADTAMEKV